jgi:signal-transduction protein with cAMP-binding, CBS, and nucleotidyltransferase domain
MLSNKVSEIMTSQLTSTTRTTPVSEVLRQMAAQDIGRIIIMDADVPVGIFTERDVVRRVLARQLDAQQTTIADVMTSPVRAVREETLISDAFARMYKGKYRHLLVRGRRGRIVGILSMRRILKIAVELGQGRQETQSLGSIATAKAATIDADTKVSETVKLMTQRNLSAVIVTAAGAPAGIFTERDALKRVAAAGLDPGKTAMSGVMTSPPVMMPHTALVGAALAEMYSRDIRHMPVSEGGTVMGLLSMPDILQYAQAFDFDEHVRRTWKEVEEFLESEDQYTPG